MLSGCLVCGLAMLAGCGVDADASTAPERMVAIPGGEFAMGSAEADALGDEGPVHRVRVKASGDLDRRPVDHD